MKMLPGVVGAGGLRLADGQVLALTPQQAAATPEGSVFRGVRPEAFRTDGAGPALTARLEIVQPTGSRALGGLTLAGQRVTAELDALAGATLDRELGLVVAMGRTLFFDPATGRTLAREAG